MTGSSRNISIVLAKRGGTEEAFAQQLSARIKNVRLNDAADPTADLNYYISADARTAPAPTPEMGWIAKVGMDIAADDPILRIAQGLDRVVAPSRAVRDQLVNAGVADVVVIEPGVDLDAFDVRLRVGVIVETEADPDDQAVMVSAFSAMENLDWEFLRPGQPDGYRSVDCVVMLGNDYALAGAAREALAVGTPVVATAVVCAGLDNGCVSYQPDDPSDLGRVLLAQLESKRALRASVQDHSWDTFAAAHEALFGAVSRVSADALMQSPVRLLLHGGEHKTLGGPTVRVPKTALALQALGVPARSEIYDPNAVIHEDTVHLFNVWPPQSALTAIRDLKAAGKRVVFSPIYLDFSERAFWQFELPDLTPDDVKTRATERRDYAQGRGRMHEPVPGYHAMVREMLDLADHVIFLSESERAALASIGAHVEDGRASLVANPVDADVWRNGDPELFRATHLAGVPGPKDYVICVGRIEERKNQLILAQALRDLPVRPVFIGHQGNPEYAAKVRAAAGPDAVMLGRIAPESDMLRSALAGAAAFALPSWAEGAALAALEAAACGTALVLGDRSSEQDYFGDLARYCDPGDPESIRDAVELAMQDGDDPAHGKALRTRVETEYSLQTYAQGTLAAYEAALATKSPRPFVGPEMVSRGPQVLVLDITPVDSKGPNQSAQTDRTNADLVRALGADQPVRMICHDPALRRFVDVPARFETLERALAFCQNRDALRNAVGADLDGDCTVLSIGGAWQEQPDYLRDLETLKSETDCQFLALLHGLDAVRFAHEYPAKQADALRRGLHYLSALADGFITPDQNTARDLRRALAGRSDSPFDITCLPLDDIIAPVAPPEETARPSPVQTTCAGLDYVLAVGDVDRRSNFEMLHKVWSRFAEEGDLPDLHLVIAGALGPNGHEIADRIARDPRANERIHILTDVSAAELSWLYENCLFTALPAHNPGWARRAVESLHHTKLCLASTEAQVPDVATALIEWIDPDNQQAWARQIAVFATLPSARALREQMIAKADWMLPTAKSIADRLQDIATAPRPVRVHAPIHVGAVVAAGAGGQPLALRFSAGWHTVEDGVRWASATDVSVSLMVTGQTRDASRLIVLLNLHTQLPDDQTVPFSIACDGQTLLHTQVSGTRFCEAVFVAVPTSALDQNGAITLSLHLPLTAHRANQPPDGIRNVGVGLRSVQVFDPKVSYPLLGLSQPELWGIGHQEMNMVMALPDHRHALAKGLVWSPGWGAGAKNGTFDFWLPILPGAPAQEIDLSLRPIAKPTRPVRATFRLNGRLIGERIWQDTVPETLKAALNAEDLVNCGPAILTIETDSLMTPADLGLGATDTLSGLGLCDVILRPQEDA